MRCEIIVLYSFVFPRSATIVEQESLYEEVLRTRDEKSILQTKFWHCRHVFTAYSISKPEYTHEKTSKMKRNYILVNRKRTLGKKFVCLLNESEDVGRNGTHNRALLVLLLCARCRNQRLYKTLCSAIASIKVAPLITRFCGSLARATKQ